MLKIKYNVVMPSGVYKRDPSKKYGMAANPNREETVRKIVAKRRANGSYKYKTGKEHPLWKGGRIVESNGYVIVYAPDHPAKIHGKYVHEHRYVMEKHLGRPLLTSEEIHHIDGDRTNNQIDNLLLFPSKSDHLKYHWALQKENGNNHGRWHHA